MQTYQQQMAATIITTTTTTSATAMDDDTATITTLPVKILIQMSITIGVLISVYLMGWP